MGSRGAALKLVDGGRRRIGRGMAALGLGTDVTVIMEFSVKCDDADEEDRTGDAGGCMFGYEG